MRFDEQVQQAIDTIIDVCAFYEGKDCDKCEAKELCQASKPIDLLNNK